MVKYYVRIVVLLFMSNTFSNINACAYVINKTIIQPTCGSNGLLSFSITPPPSVGANYRVFKDGQFLVSINGSIANLNSLTPGSYKVVVTDNASGCKDSLDNIVLDPAANALSASHYIDSPRCDTSTNGRLALKVKNAAAGTITYAWRKDGLPFTNNDSIVQPAMKGKYSVTITDAASCRFELDNMEVLELKGKMLAIDTIVFPTSCDSPNGKITINISARHFNPFNWQKKIRYIWLNRPDRDTFNFIDSLPAGKYTLVVTDSLQCYPLEIKDIEIKQNPKPTAVIRGTDTLCANIGFGKLEAFLTLGDSMNIKYYWNQGQNTKIVEGAAIVAGDYECVVEDLAGCVDTARWTIHPYPEKVINIVPEYREVLQLTPQLLRIDNPQGLYNIVWSSNPVLKYDILSNKDSVIRSNNITENTTYFVVAKYGPNCETKNNIIIKVIEKIDAIKDENIPNIFTPGALKNSKYRLINLDNNGGAVKLFNSFEFKVYDRWGNLIFNADKESFEWDGTDAKGQLVMNGVYAYLMKYSTVDRPFDNQLRKGTILLER
jgi:gliding motility-associated-like protein